MTREEAICELSVIWERLSHPEDCENGCYSFRDGDYLEALDMAIEALQGDMYCPNCGVRLVPEDEYIEPTQTHGRLIDADALAKLLFDISKEYEDAIESEKILVQGAIRRCRHAVVNAPTVQADRPHGEWIRRDNYKVMGEGYIWHCSICDEKVYQDSSRDYPHDNFCPNCGADMRKENK